MYTYSDPGRESDPHALPDVEVIFHDEAIDCLIDEKGDELPTGWYYMFCFPGCLPDSGPIGPYDSKEAAIEAARKS